MAPHSKGRLESEGQLARIAIAFTTWSERWYPDTFVFAALAVLVVAGADLILGAQPKDIATSFGTGFWSLIPFTMQMAFVAITGYVLATSPPCAKLIDAIARIPQSGRGAVGYIAVVTMIASLFNWALSLVLGGLLVVALARRTDLKMDYRAAGAAAYLGLGATWALGLNSSAAQLQANAASLPKPIADITGIIPFSQTIGLWQSQVMAVLILLISVAIAYLSCPSGKSVKTAQEFGIDLSPLKPVVSKAERPGEWLEYSPIISIAFAIMGFGYLWVEFSTKDALLVISNLNTYNFMFLMAGVILHWRLHSFLGAVAKAVPTTGGVLIQFPLYGAIAALLTTVKGVDGTTISQHLAGFFVGISTRESFAVVMGVYSAILGFLVPSGGGKWIVEAPYVMQAAKDLNTHMGWAVQVYNAAEAIPNLINPFWMLPLLGVLGLKARDLVGFTFTQLIFHVPFILFLLWFFGRMLLPA